MSKTVAQRQREYRKRKKASGYRLLGSIHITKEAAEILDSYKITNFTIDDIISAALIAFGTCDDNRGCNK